MSGRSKTSLNSSSADDVSKDDDEIRLRKKHKVCGFLKKYGGQKRLKSKTYWFMYAENTCRLVYFESCQHTEPSGDIDISRASFSWGNEDCNRPGLFQISTPGQIIELEAKDQNSAFHWLQQLQKCRKRFSSKKTASYKRYGVTFISHVGGFKNGLLKDNFSDEENDYFEQSLEVPVDVGEDLLFKGATNFNSILNNLRTQLRCGFTNILVNRSSDQKEDCAVDDTRSKFGKHRTSSRHSLPFNFGTREQVETTMPIDREMKAEIVMLRNNIDNLKMELRANIAQAQHNREMWLLAIKQKESVEAFYSTLSEEPQDDQISAIEKDAELALAVKEKDQLRYELDELHLRHMQLQKEFDDLSKLGQLRKRGDDRFSRDAASCSKDHIEQSRERQDDLIHTWTLIDAPPIREGDMEKVIGDLDKLSDEVQAFRLQNRFLNSEILQLNLLRKDSDEREALIQTTSKNWEGKYFAIQSKFNMLMKEIRDPVGPNSTHITSRILYEAFHDEDGPDYLSTAKVMESTNIFDIYGFLSTSVSTPPSHKEEFMQKAVILKLRSRAVYEQQLKNEYSLQWLNRWDNFMLHFDSRNFQRSSFLKNLIRTGIPFIYRCAIWKSCVYYRVKSIRDSKPRDYYQSLLAIPKEPTAAEKQIELDLPRTLPNNRHFLTPQSDGQPKLRRILMAYIRHNEDVGYCQGINRLAAIALLFLNEEDSFWCVVCIVEVLKSPDSYTSDLIGTVVDQMVLRELLAEKLARMHNHLKEHNIDIALPTCNWFMCLFADEMPVDTYLCIWDVFLFEGNKILFRFALAFLKLFEEECLQFKNTTDTMNALKKMVTTIVDWRIISQVAFNELNPFPMKLIKSKREHYLAIVTQDVARANRERAATRESDEAHEREAAREKEAQEGNSSREERR